MAVSQGRMLGIVIFVFLAINACWAAVPVDLIRPCRLSDNYCIATNLRANSRCNPRVRGSLPGKYTLFNQRFDTPYFNASQYEKSLIVRNHNKCVVSEFYFKAKRDIAVLSLDCPLLDFESNRTLIQHYTKKEDSEFNYHIRGIYPLIRLTTTLRHADHLNICTSFVYGDVTALPVFVIDPLDQRTSKFLSTDLSYLNIYERETIAARAGWLLRNYVNAYICDFKC